MNLLNRSEHQIYHDFGLSICSPTHAIKKEIKDSIIRSFCHPDSHLRIVTCTVAFGMGIDCPNVRQIVHWSAPADIEAYQQETGRAGRDGLQACAVLFVAKADLTPRLVDDDVRTYCNESEVCRRELLFKHFDKVDFKACCSGCRCCDACMCKTVYMNSHGTHLK